MDERAEAMQRQLVDGTMAWARQTILFASKMTSDTVEGYEATQMRADRILQELIDKSTAGVNPGVPAQLIGPLSKAVLQWVCENYKP